MAVDECTDFQFKSPFLPGESCEGIYEKNLESHDQPGYYWILSREYCGMSYTGSSCEDIYNKHPETHDKSGYYRINNNDWTYCEMTLKADPDEYFIPQCGGGGWRKIVLINISAGDDCPPGWLKSMQSGVSFCRVVNDSRGVCSSATFSTGEASYQRVCGRARGYQKGFVWGFYGLNSRSSSIDDVYASSLSITHGNPRQHIWTFVCGFSDSYNDGANCPCAVPAGRNTRSFVGNDYYCESGTSTNYPSTKAFYFNDTLWDGAGCAKSTCCANTTQPWFNHQLGQSTQDDIEARICVVGPFERGSVLIDLIEIYVQ